MKDCECLEECRFFHDELGKNPATVELIKKHYCREENSACALYMIRLALGPQKVPTDLLPFDFLRAWALIES